MNSGMVLMVVVIGLALVGGTLFTLWWWRVADRWADGDKKRFAVKVDDREKVVVKRDEDAGG